MSQASSSEASLQEPPAIPPDSPGSSVSTRLQEEYDELLKHAVVVPDSNHLRLQGMGFENGGLLDGLGEDIASVRASAQRAAERARLRDVEDEDSERTPREGADNFGGSRNGLPDFGQSPINAHTHSSSFGEHRRKERSDGMNGGSHFYNGMFSGTDRARAEASVVREAMETAYRATLDHDMGKMETMMDQWCLELKRNVLAEFSQAKIILEQKCREELIRETERHAKEKEDLIVELNGAKELLLTYQQTRERKDSIISNLTSAIQKQRDKMELMKNFCHWRSQHNDIKRENFAMQLARKHYERSLNQRVLGAWFSLIHSKWRQRVEKACQVKAQEVCMQVTADYEAKISSLNEAQEQSRVEVRRLHVQRESYEEAMKKAFMRGVCALNMEAMSIFHGEETDPDPEHHDRGVIDTNLSNFASLVPEKGLVVSKSIPQDTVRASVSADAPPPRVVTSQGLRSSAPANTAPRQTSAKPASVTTTAYHKPRGSAKGTGRGGDSGHSAGGRSKSPRLDAPMASVVVERHHPVTKQTIGQATALRLQKTGAADSDRFRKLAGQEAVGKVAPPIQTVRVVD